MNVAFKSSFLKNIKKVKGVGLQEAIFEVINHVEQVESLTDIKNIKKLKGYSIYYRIRIGNYRIGLKWEETDITRSTSLLLNTARIFTLNFHKPYLSPKISPY